MIRLNNRPTDEECATHLRSGTRACLVCDAPELCGEWTDYNGQLRCRDCGTTYQVVNCKLSDELLAQVGVSKDEVKTPYCDCFMIVPLLRDYHRETKRKAPLGTYLGRGRISNADYEAFSHWLRANADRYREEYAAEFRWDLICGWKEKRNE